MPQRSLCLRMVAVRKVCQPPWLLFDTTDCPPRATTTQIPNGPGMLLAEPCGDAAKAHVGWGIGG